MLKLNLGSGKKELDGYINIDAIKHSDTTIVADILNLDYSDNSVDEIYSEHVVEHLDKNELDLFFSEASRMLKLGGKLQIIAPSMRSVILAYVNKEININYLDNFLFALHEHKYDFHKQGIYKEKFEKLCNKYNFKIINISYRSTTVSNYEIFMEAFLEENK